MAMAQAALAGASVLLPSPQNAGNPSGRIAAGRAPQIGSSSSSRLGLGNNKNSGRLSSSSSRLMRARSSTGGGGGGGGRMYGEDPAWSDEDFVVVGLGHCFMEDGEGKLQECLVIEPIAAGALECMENGGKTCYKHIVGTRLGVVLQQDVSLLPPEFSSGRFADEFEFRAKCASRNWKREYNVEVLRKLAPEGVVRSDFNFSLEDKRVLNMVNVVTDADNIKQDMSIDVYGRKKDDEAAPAAAAPSKAEEFSSEIASLYNV